MHLKNKRAKRENPETTPVDGYLGSREDEERSETRYVMRIAGTSEPSNLRTHLALPAPPGARLSECRPQDPSPSLSLQTAKKKVALGFSRRLSRDGVARRTVRHLSRYLKGPSPTPVLLFFISYPFF